jgi:hypothetical protein
VPVLPRHGLLWRERSRVCRAPVAVPAGFFDGSILRLNLQHMSSIYSCRKSAGPSQNVLVLDVWTSGHEPARHSWPFLHSTSFTGHFRSHRRLRIGWLMVHLAMEANARPHKREVCSAVRPPRSPLFRGSSGIFFSSCRVISPNITTIKKRVDEEGRLLEGCPDAQAVSYGRQARGLVSGTASIKIVLEPYPPA